MKWLLYNILFAIAYMAMMPYFLFRMKRRGGYRERMADRFAKYPDFENLPSSPVWVHAVSVGEVQVAGQFMRSVRAIAPDMRFVFSTTSSTGWKIAAKELEGHPEDILIYNPLDFPRYVKRAIAKFRPRAVVLTETEIWPNFIRQLKKCGVPVYLVNARISDRSAKRYPKVKFFLGEIFASFAKIWAQSDEDKRRLVAAGARPEAIEVTGSFKFDVARRNPAKEAELAAWLERKPGEVLLAGGSTWPGEDAFLLGVFKKLVQSGAAVKLCIAPRHFEKADAVEANILSAGFACVRRSRGDRASAGSKTPVYLCDTTGELMGLYGVSDVVYVGKNLFAKGSQNMIEPCLTGAATVVGPDTQNFRPVMSDLLAAGAIVQGADAKEVEDALIRFAREAAARRELGERARAAVESRKGLTDRIAKEFVESFKTATRL